MTARFRDLLATLAGFALVTSACSGGDTPPVCGTCEAAHYECHDPSWQESLNLYVHSGGTQSGGCDGELNGAAVHLDCEPLELCSAGQCSQMTVKDGIISVGTMSCDRKSR